MLQAGRYHEAYAIARSIPNIFGQRARTLATVIQSVNKSEAAKDFRSTVNNRSNYLMEDYAALVRGLAAAGLNGEAVIVASAIPDSGRPTQPVSEIFRAQDQRCLAFCWIAESLAASHAYRQAVASADNCSSALTRLRAYTEILTAFAVDTNPNLKKALEDEKTLNY